MHSDEKARGGQRQRSNGAGEREVAPVIPSVIALPPPEHGPGSRDLPTERSASEPGVETLAPGSPALEIPERPWERSHSGARTERGVEGRTERGDHARAERGVEGRTEQDDEAGAEQDDEAGAEQDDDARAEREAGWTEPAEGSEIDDVGTREAEMGRGSGAEDETGETFADEETELQVAIPPPPPVSRDTAGRRSHVSPALVSLDRVLDDDYFRVRPEGELSLLATDIARLGQLSPVDVRLVPPDRFQVVCGFRRVAALRFLHREKVLARLHTDLSDDDALVLALASAIHARPVGTDELQLLREQLDRAGRLTPVTRDMLDKALAGDDGLAPETVGEDEIDADELAAEATERLGELNQDLALIAGVFDSLDESRRAQLLEQLRYSADLVAFLEGK